MRSGTVTIEVCGDAEVGGGARVVVVVLVVLVVVLVELDELAGTVGGEVPTVNVATSEYMRFAGTSAFTSLTPATRNSYSVFICNPDNEAVVLFDNPSFTVAKSREPFTRSSMT